jgi:hypothetical protein
MTKKHTREQRPKLSLSPLSVDEAVSDILKIGPMPKPPKKKRKAKRRPKSN